MFLEHLQHCQDCNSTSGPCGSLPNLLCSHQWSESDHSGKDPNLRLHLPLKKSIPWGKNWYLFTLIAAKLRCRQSHRHPCLPPAFSSSLWSCPPDSAKSDWPENTISFLQVSRVGTGKGCALMPSLLKAKDGIPAFTSQTSESQDLEDPRASPRTSGREEK